MNKLNGLSAAALLLLLMLLASCAPRVQQQLDPGTGPVFPIAQSQAEQPALQTAKIIWHRMEAGYLQTGRYSTDVLIELTDLPRGVAFMMESFPGESFELRVTDDALPGVFWLVDPAGITRHDTYG